MANFSAVLSHSCGNALASEVFISSHFSKPPMCPSCPQLASFQSAVTFQSFTSSAGFTKVEGLSQSSKFAQKLRYHKAPRSHSILASPNQRDLASGSFSMQRCSRDRAGKLNALIADSISLSSDQQKWKHKLPSGLEMEVISQKGKETGVEVPPLVFVHGSYHAAWCWTVHWMPFFSEFGHDCYSISLLGQGDSSVPDSAVAGTIQSHASDISDLIYNHLESPPILIGHSFGGLIVQAYLADVAPTWTKSSFDGNSYPLAKLSGAILACSVPPTGNMELVKRFMKTDFVASIKITLSLAAKLYGTSVSLCRESFFSPAMSDEQVKKYQVLLKQSSKIPLFDLRHLNANLPVAKPPEHAPPVLVLGAKNDFIVDEIGVVETGEFFNTSPVFIDDVAHDIMLDLEWEKCASIVQNWIRRNVLSA